MIGLGKMGFGYDAAVRLQTSLSHTGSLLRHPEFDLLYGIDEAAEHRRAFSHLTGLPAFQSLASVSQLPGVDVVIIATPTDTHAGVLDEVLKLGPRCILLEKPVAHSSTVAQRMLEVADARDCAVFVNYMRSADASLLQMQVFASRAFSQDAVRGTFAYTGSLIHSGSHGLHLLRTLLGRITGGYLTHSEEVVSQRREPSGGLLKFESASITLVPLPALSYETLQIHIWGARGQLTIDGRLSYAEFKPWIWDDVYGGEKILGPPLKTWSANEGTYQLQVLDQIVQHLHGGQTTLCRLRDAVDLQIEIDELGES